MAKGVIYLMLLSGQIHIEIYKPFCSVPLSDSFYGNIFTESWECMCTKCFPFNIIGPWFVISATNFLEKKCNFLYWPPFCTVLLTLLTSDQFKTWPSLSLFVCLFCCIILLRHKTLWCISTQFIVFIVKVLEHFP